MIFFESLPSLHTKTFLVFNLSEPGNSGSICYVRFDMKDSRIPFWLKITLGISVWEAGLSNPKVKTALQVFWHSVGFKWNMVFSVFRVEGSTFCLYRTTVSAGRYSSHL